MITLRLSPPELELLVKRAQGGDRKAVEEVLRHFEGAIRREARRGNWFIPGAEPEDVEQEARIGLYNAIEQYDPTKGSLDFSAFAMKVCVKRAIITALSKENRRRMYPLNSGVSLSTPVMTSDGDSRQTLEEFIPDDSFNLEEMFAAQDEENTLHIKLCERLTGLERSVYILYRCGDTYREIGSKLKQTQKAVDNALTRVRKKKDLVLREYLVECRSKPDWGMIDEFTKTWDCENLFEDIEEDEIGDEM